MQRRARRRRQLRAPYLLLMTCLSLDSSSSCGSCRERRRPPPFCKMSAALRRHRQRGPLRRRPAPQAQESCPSATAPQRKHHLPRPRLLPLPRLPQPPLPPSAQRLCSAWHKSLEAAAGAAPTAGAGWLPTAPLLQQQLPQRIWRRGRWRQHRQLPPALMVASLLCSNTSTTCKRAGAMVVLTCLVLSCSCLQRCVHPALAGGAGWSASSSGDCSERPRRQQRAGRPSRPRPCPRQQQRLQVRGVSWHLCFACHAAASMGCLPARWQN